jgi:hypothetical protein
LIQIKKQAFFGLVFDSLNKNKKFFKSIDTKSIRLEGKLGRRAVLQERVILTTAYRHLVKGEVTVESTFCSLTIYELLLSKVCQNVMVNNQTRGNQILLN